MPAIGTVKAPGYPVRATFLHSNTCRARNGDANERPVERMFLVARPVGIVAALSVSSVRSGTDGSSADAYRHSTAYGCATVNTAAIGSAPIGAAAISAAVMDANAANTSAPTAICERIT